MLKTAKRQHSISVHRLARIEDMLREAKEGEHADGDT